LITAAHHELRRLGQSCVVVDEVFLKVSQGLQHSGKVAWQSLEVGKELSPLVDAVKSGGASGFRAVHDEMQRLEGIRGELEMDLTAIVDQRRLLEMDRLSNDMVLDRYRDLKDVLESADGQELTMLLSTIIRRVDWQPDAEGSRGGRYKMALHALPLTQNNLSPRQGPGDTVGSHYCLNWLPG